MIEFEEKNPTVIQQRKKSFKEFREMNKELRRQEKRYFGKDKVKAKAYARACKAKREERVSEEIAVSLLTARILEKYLNGPEHNAFLHVVRKRDKTSSGPRQI